MTEVKECDDRIIKSHRGDGKSCDLRRYSRRNLRCSSQPAIHACRTAPSRAVGLKQSLMVVSPMVSKIPHVKTKTDPDKIAQAVRRYMKGEEVRALAKEYRVSVPGIYLWIKKAKEDAAQQQRRREIGNGGVQKEDEIATALMVRNLEQENERLKKRLLEYMIKSGDI